MQKFSIEKHALVPKHAKISEKEKNEILATYSITLKELPRMHPGDPAIQELDAKEGDVIKITRNSPTAGESVFYRRVTRG